MFKGNYRTIVADPPWQYANKRTGGSLKSGSAAHYPTMPINDIINLPIGDFAAPDSYLFLWVPDPLLPEGMTVMDEWEYKYVGKITWRKTGKPGMGFNFRGSIENCLYGRHGVMPALHCQKENFIESPRGKHSTKPQAFFDLVTPVTPAPRLELFAREHHTGWDAKGFEIDGEIL